MEFRKERLSCSDARNYDMVNYLAALGIEPVKIRGNNFWYLSPFREERTPSFKVDRQLNRWYDFGEGKGGSLIDFAIRYTDCTIGEFLQTLSSERFPVRLPNTGSSIPGKREPAIIVQQEFTLTAFHLLQYLKERRIPLELADQYCREIRYQLHGKSYYAIGFKNDSGGWELRNRYFKGCTAPKDYTSIKTGAAAIAVFEGFFDFLSYLAITEDADVAARDFLILNSLSLFERARPVMEGYESIHLFLDNNTAGHHCCLYARSLSVQYRDERAAYRNYEDINDWLNNKPITNTGSLLPGKGQT